MNNVCRLCRDSISYCDEFEEHVLQNHMMSYSKYYEYCKMNSSICNDKESSTYPMSLWYGIDCPDDVKYSSKEYYECLLHGIKEIYEILCNNRFIRLFVLNKNLRESLIGFNLIDYCKTLENVSSNLHIDDINLFKIRTVAGKSPYINKNMDNIVIDKSNYNILSSELNDISGVYKLNINGNLFELRIPEYCDYHNNNHYKYNILNRSNNPQSAKKLLLSNGKCIKFYNTNFDRCKSIIRVSKNGSEVYSSLISEFELDYIKYYIMSNKKILKSVLDILYELIKNCNTMYDYCFVLNKVLVNKSGKFDMNIDWTVNNKMLSSSKDTLNISIL